MISYINSFTATGTTGNATINMSGLQAGDLLISWLNVHGPSGPPTCVNPTGWSLVMPDLASGAYLLRTGYHLWQPGETSYVWTMSNTDRWSVGVMVIRGADMSLPIGLTSSTYNMGGTTATASGIAVLAPGCMGLTLYGCLAATPRTFSTPSGMTEAFDVNYQTGLAADYQVLSVVGVTGDKVATTSGTTLVWVARQVVISPLRTNKWHYGWVDGAAVPAYVTKSGTPAYVYDRPHPFTLSDMNISGLQPELGLPECHGQSLRFTWANREPTEGSRSWDDIDAALAGLSGYPGKKLMLRISAGALSPQWVTDAGAQTVLYQSQNVPITWDPIYLAKWLNFVGAFGAKYNGHPLIYAIQMTGGGKGGEMSLGADWPIAASSYTDAMMIATWETIIDAYHTSFPDTPCYIDIMEPVLGTSNVVPSVLAYGVTNYPEWFRAQNNGLNGTGAGPWGRNILQATSLGTPIGYQMTGSVNWNPASVGDRQTAFQIALDDKATHVEIYHDDYADGSFASALRFLAGLS
jgi:hypothetical protein